MSAPESKHSTATPPSGSALLPMQEGMLFNWLARGEHEIQQLVLRPPVGVTTERLRRGFETAIARHVALRTTIRYGGTESPHGVAHSAAPMAWSVETATQTLDSLLSAFLQRDRRNPLDIETLPVMRFTQLCAQDGEALVWTFLHTHLDGRSIRLVLDDVLRDYLGLGMDTSPAPDPSLHVAAALDPQRLAAARAYYRERLKGLHDPTPTPGWRSDSTERTSPGGSREICTRVTPADMRALDDLARLSGSSWASAVNAAWALVLCQYGYSSDVVFGVTRACRNLTPSSRSTVGCLINTVPMRVEVNPEEEVAAYLARVHGSARTPAEFEPLSLRDAASVSELRDSRQLVRTIVVCEDHTLEESIHDEYPALADWHVHLHGKTAASLTLAAYRRNDGSLDLFLEYDQQHIEPSTAEAIGPAVARLLGAFGANPHARLVDLPTESSDAVIMGPDTSCKPETVAELLTQAMVAHGHAIAVEEPATGHTLRFAELRTHAERLVASLRQQGVRSGEVVGVVATRSTDTVVALTACQLAGLVYLPLDPTLPQERLAFKLEDSGACAIVHPGGRVESRSRSRRGADGTGDGSDGDADELSPESPAYLIYTSGSTGTPKGVLVPHRALAAHARAAKAMLQLTPDDRVMQFASPSFDVYLEEVVPTLSSGGCVVVRDEDSASSTSRLLTFAERQGITVLQLPTAYFHEVVRDLEQSELSLPVCVRVVVIGGERVSGAACQRFRRRAPHVRLINAYGPTEVTVTSAYYDVPTVVPADIPIGRPLGACRAHLLDRWSRIAPVGAIGELTLSGPQVALGYLGRSADTARSFSRHSSQSPNYDVYRTGDLARVNAAGQLTFVGRIDGQVKVRGYRVELGEVERALESDPMVAQAACSLVRAPSGETVLVGFVVARSLPFREQDALATISGFIPPYMMPTRVFDVPQLPTTPGGKLDRGKLTWPEEQAPNLHTDEPRNATERILGEIFRDVLGDVGMRHDDSFFDRGGTSIRALRLVAQVEERLGARPTIATLVTHPSPRSLARWVLATSAAAPRAEVVPLNACSAPLTPVYCMVGLHVYAAFARGIQQRPVFGVYVDEELEFPAETLKVEKLAASYLRAIEAQGDPPKIVVGFSFGAFVALELAHQLHERGTPPDLVVMLDPRFPSSLNGRLVDPLRNFVARLRLAPATIVERAQERARRVLSNLPPAEPLPQDQVVWAAREQAYTRALEAYEPTFRPYPGMAQVYLARDDDPAHVPKLREQWRSVLGPGSVVDVVPGTHGALLQAPVVHQISAKVDAALRLHPSNKPSEVSRGSTGG